MELAGLVVVSWLLQDIHFHTKSRIRDRVFVLLGHVQLALLLEPRASVPLTRRKALNWGQCAVSCCVRHRCDGMGSDAVG
jgi:hypothetical protein